MNKTQIIENIAAQHGITKVAAKAIFEQIFADIEAALVNKQGDHKFQIPGFGSFKLDRRDARTGRNPKTGESMKIAAKNVIKFKISSTLSDKIN